MVIQQNVPTRSVILGITTAALLLAWIPSSAQVTCQTGNCTTGMTAGSPDLPAQCQSIATPRTIQISMTNSPFRFEPANIRIEGESSTSGVPWSYQCIIWHKIDAAPWHSATDDTVGDSCDTAQGCASTNLTPPCDWETGNIDNALEFGSCHYAAVSPATYEFRCRLHQGLGMVGTLTVVQPIELAVGLDVSGDPVLDWLVGGVGPWTVQRDSVADMPVPVNLTAGGTTARTFTDITSGAIAFYLVTELTVGCGNGIVEGTELCDGADVGAETCVTQGFDGGVLACNSTCDGFDTSMCTTCGDTVCEAFAGEDCVSCSADCNGVQGGNPQNRYCCGDGDGEGPIPCSDSRCTEGGNTCVE